MTYVRLIVLSKTRHWCVSICAHNIWPIAVKRLVEYHMRWIDKWLLQGQPLLPAADGRVALALQPGRRVDGSQRRSESGLEPGLRRGTGGRGDLDGERRTDRGARLGRLVLPGVLSRPAPRLQRPGRQPGFVSVI